ncbi:hypothetical protein [Teredinibacter turnerae]|uniref:hypothetical protein n=1 Tax=Teredinibacter turnerae TaxID=2426 RepID=UPI00031AD246|nr:hypothetical protein [Teredinibacter turnerae]
MATQPSARSKSQPRGGDANNGIAADSDWQRMRQASPICTAQFAGFRAVTLTKYASSNTELKYRNIRENSLYI